MHALYYSITSSLFLFVCAHRYVTQVMNVIDVVAIVPFYIELGTSSGSSIGTVMV